MSKPPTTLSLLAGLGCLLAVSAQAQTSAPHRPDLSLDLNLDGRTDFVLSLTYSGFSPENPNQLKHLLKPSGTNQVWCVTNTGQPATFDDPVDWTPGESGTQGWAAGPAAGFALQDYSASGGDPRFGGGTIKRVGPLGRITDNPLDHPTPPTFLVVRFGTDAGWQTGWIQLKTFKHRYEQWTPRPSDFFPPIPPGEVRLLDLGSASNPGGNTLRLGSNSTLPTRPLSISHYVDPANNIPYLQLRITPVRAWETLEMAPKIDATTWERIPTANGAVSLALRVWPGPEDFSPKFFRLR